MKATSFCRWMTGWLVELALAGLLLADAWADRVILKDGTEVEGEILSETETEVVVERKFSGGRITAKENIDRGRISEIRRATDAEKAQQKMELAYEATKKYQLSRLTSYPLEYYAQVIDGSFRKFLTDYPDSPYAEEIAKKILEWESEREKVAAGQAKYNGQWMPATEAAQKAVQEKGQALVQEARTLLGVQRFQEAIQRLDQVMGMPDAGKVGEAAERLRRQAYQNWMNMLVQRRQALEKEIPTIEQQLAAAQKEVADAQAAVQRAQGTGFKTAGNSGTKLGSGGTKLGGGTAGTVDAGARLSKARSELIALQNRLPLVRMELEQVKRDLTMLEGKANVGTVQTASVGTTPSTVSSGTSDGAATTPAPVESAAGGMVAGGEDDILVAIASFFKKNWLYVAGALLLILWYVSHRLGQ